MNRIKLTVLSLMLCGISGCTTTTPGKLAQEDLVSKTLQLDVPVNHALSTFYEGHRYCGSESGGAVFVTLHGVPECAPIRPDGSAVCDIYSDGVNGRSDFILGRADFVPENGGTRVTFSVRSLAAKKDKILAAWEMFAKGEAKSVCP